MAYADFTYYIETYLGKAVPEAEFARTSERATEILDWLTFSRIKEAIEPVKKACCAIAEVYYKAESAGDGIKKSESVGSHSVTYADVTAASSAAAYYMIAARYLGDTGLLYRGLYDNEC